MEHEAPPWPVPSGTASTSKHATTPETSSPSSPGSQPGLGFAGEPGPLGRWPALGGGKGAVTSGCGPGAPDHRRTKERPRRRRRYAATASIAAELADPVDRAFIADPVEATRAMAPGRLLLAPESWPGSSCRAARSQGRSPAQVVGRRVRQQPPTNRRTPVPCWHLAANRQTSSAVVATEGVRPYGTSPARRRAYGLSAVTSTAGCPLGSSNVETSW
jgi:hypothetical protein